MSGLPFVNVKKIVIAHLNGLQVPSRRDKPTPLDASTPAFVQVFRAPGSESEHTLNARVDLHVFAGSEEAMWALAEQAHEAIHKLSGRKVDGHRFDNVRTIQDPSDLPWSASVFRAISTYEIPVRPA